MVIPRKERKHTPNVYRVGNCWAGLGGGWMGGGGLFAPWFCDWIPPVLARKLQLKARWGPSHLKQLCLTRWAHNDSKSRAIRVAGRHIGPCPFCRRLGTNWYCVKWRSFSPSQIALWGWKLNTGKPSWRGIQDLSFATKHGYVSLFF